MVSGRLREHDREQIAKDMVEWAKKPDSFNLNGFCGQQLIDPTKITKWAKEDETFCQAYKITKALLASRREKGLVEGKVHVKAYDLNATVYDQFLKEERREEAEFTSSLKKQEDNNLNQQLAQSISDAIKNKTAVKNVE